MSDGRWLVLIRSAPRELSGREILELVLAGASLDIGLDVVFSGPGLRHLRGNEMAGWRQLLDYDMAALWRLDASDSVARASSGVGQIDEDALQRMKSRAAGVLEL